MSQNTKILFILIFAGLALWVVSMKSEKPKVTQNSNPEPIPKPKIATDSSGNVWLENPEDFEKGTIIQVVINGEYIEAVV
jgi:hypothetical protein